MSDQQKRTEETLNEELLTDHERSSSARSTLVSHDPNEKN